MSKVQFLEQERAYIEALAAEAAILQAECEEHQRDYFKYLDWIAFEEQCNKVIHDGADNNEVF